MLLSWLPKLDYQPSIGTTAWGRSVSSYYTKTERQNKLINPMNDDMNIKYKKKQIGTFNFVSVGLRLFDGWRVIPTRSHLIRLLK